MPLLSTRASASSAGYGQNLNAGQTAFTGYGYAPYYDSTYTGVTDMRVLANGTAFYVVGSKFDSGTSTYSYAIFSYSRDSGTGKVTYVSTTIVTTGAGVSSAVLLALSPDNTNLYVTFANNATSSSDSTNLIYQYSINATTKNIALLSPAFVSVATGAGVVYPSFSTDSKFLYVGSRSTNKIFIYSRNTTSGLLTFSNVYTTPVNTRPQCPLVSTDNAFLYTSSSGTDANNAVLQYSRNTLTGNITPLSPEGVSGGASMSYLNINPTQGGLHSASTSTGLVYNYGRNLSTGLVTLASTQGGSIVRVTFNNIGTVMLGVNAATPIANQTTQSGFQGTIASGSGAVTQYNNPRFVSIASVTFLINSPTYDYYYSVGSGAILQWQLVGGYLELVDCPSPLGGRLNTATNGSPSFVGISPDQKSLYVNGYFTSGGLAGTTKYGTQFNLDVTTKVPTRATSTSYGGSQGPGPLVISSDSAFLYQVDHDNNPPVIRQYSRNTTSGDLTPLSSPTINLPTPNSYSSSFVRDSYGEPILSADGKNLYISWHSTSFGVSAVPYIIQYSRNTTTGLLTLIGTVTIGTDVIISTPSSTYYTEGLQLAIHPNDNFIFCSSGVDASTTGIYTFSRNPTTGVLTQSSFLSIASVTSNWCCVSPNGNNLYTNYNSAIYIYTVNSSTGAVSYVKNNRYSYSNLELDQWSKLFIAPNGSFLITYLYDTGPTSRNGYILLRINTLSGDLSRIPSKTFLFNDPIVTNRQTFYGTANSVGISSNSLKFYVVSRSTFNYVGFGTLN